MVEVIHTAEAMRAWSQGRQGRIALVPTMGFLHDGHLSLIQHARSQARHVVVSIFVNPLQFGPNEDLSRYPRDLQGDLRKLQDVDSVFVPDALYPAGFDTYVEPAQLGQHLCGASRPGHFRGVCTVVAMLLRITQCHVAVFGQKDFQQLQIIKRMVRDLWLDVEIVGMPIVREADGLAMSSRNAYLSATQRQDALVLNRALRQAKARFEAGERDAEAILAEVRREIGAVARLDYAEIVDVEMLQPLRVVDRPAVCAVAAHVGKTRLIDNVIIT